MPLPQTSPTPVCVPVFQGRVAERHAIWWEVLAIFALFVLYGAYPVPDVNEQYYIGKAIHFWNADYFPNDSFLNAPDSHWFYCAVFGLFSKLMAPAALAWFGRVLIWLGAAFGWQRLSSALVRRPGASIFTAMGFLFFIEHFHLAGEWVAGGVEGKGFAFPFVFLGLADALRGRYNRAWIFLGLASAFHVLVGGWATAALLIALAPVVLHSPRSFVKRFLPGLFLGGAIALLGLIPALMLDWGVDRSITDSAHQVYVFERIAHHLVASSLPWTFRLRFALLAALWLLLLRLPSGDDFSGGEKKPSPESIWNRFSAAALLFAFVGLVLDYGSILAVDHHLCEDRRFAASLLRFYWFRLSDWVIPAAAALGGVRLLADGISNSIGNSIGIGTGSIQSSSIQTGGVENSSIQNSGVETDTCRDRVRAAAILALISPALLLFTGLKFLYRAEAVRVAAAATVDPLWPVLPRPTDGVTFLTVLVLFALAAVILRRLGWRGARELSILTAFFVCVAPLFGGIEMLRIKTEPIVPRSCPPKASIARGWLDICRWVKENTDPTAVFLVPKGCDSLKWNANRADAGQWKEIPQDARSIVEWYKKMETLYVPIGAKSSARWNQPLICALINKGRNRYDRICQEYGIDYIITELPPYQVMTNSKALERYNQFLEREVYRNSQFIVLKAQPDASTDNSPGDILEKDAPAVP